MPNDHIDIQELKDQTRQVYELLGRIQSLDPDTLIPADDVRPFLDVMRVFFSGGHNRCMFMSVPCYLSSFPWDDVVD